MKFYRSHSCSVIFNRDSLRFSTNETQTSRSTLSSSFLRPNHLSSLQRYKLCHVDNGGNATPPRFSTFSAVRDDAFLKTNRVLASPVILGEKRCQPRQNAFDLGTRRKKETSNYSSRLPSILLLNVISFPSSRKELQILKIVYRKNVQFVM